MQALLILPLVFGVSAESPAVDLEVVASEARLRSFQALARLDDEQTEALAGIAERMAADRDRYLEHRHSLLQIQRVAFESFRQENLDGGEFQDLTWRNTSRANRLGEESRNEFVRSLAVYDTLAREVLDPGQRLLLGLLEPEQFVRCALGPKERAPGDPVRRQAWGALEAVAGKKDKALARVADAEARRLLDVAEREGCAAWNRDSELARITEVLTGAGFLPEKTAERCRGVLTAELLPITEKRNAREGIDRVHKERFPDPSTLMRLLLAENAGMILRGGVGGTGSAERRAVQQLESEVIDQREQINLLNLMNGLHLSREQLSALVDLGDRVGEDSGDYVTRARPSAFASLGVGPVFLESDDEDGGQRIAQEMERFRAELGRGRLPAKKTVRRIETIAGSTPRNGPPLPKEKVDAYAREAIEILSPAQERVLIEFRACLLPPKELTDPVRVGQAGNSEKYLRELRALRELPEDRYQESRETLAEKTLSRIEKDKGSWPEDKRGQALEELLAIFDEVRELDDAAFTIRAPDLSGRMEQLELKSRFLAEMRADHQELLVARVRNHLLKPCVPELAREMIVRRDARGLPDPVDLETINPADSCKDGDCAID